MDAVIYTRVSKLDKSVSVRDQEKECRAICAAKGWPVRKVFQDDGVSASRFATKERDAWLALKDELRQGDILVVWEASRAHRDLGEYVALRELCSSLNVPLSYAGRVLDLSRGDDRFIGGLDALVAERESEQIKERVLRGKRSAAAAGKPSGRPPWGLRRKQTKEGDVIPGVWERDPREAPRVVNAVERFLAGESQRSIMRSLKDGGEYYPKSATSLHRALANPAIAGLRVHRGEVVGPGSWKGIISVEQHEAVLKRYKTIKRSMRFVSQPGPDPKYLLTGIARCGACNTPLAVKKYKAPRNPSYICPNNHVARNMEKTDKLVTESIFERIAGINPDDYNDDNPEFADIHAEIDTLEGELESWRVAVEKREVTLQSFIRMEKALISQIEELKQKTRTTTTMAPLPPGDLRRNWVMLSMQQRRDIVRGFVTVTLMPYAKVVEPCACGGKFYARGLCNPCYQKAWAEKTLPPLDETANVARVVIEQI